MSAWPVVLFIRAGEDENEASWEVPAHWSQQQGKTDLGGQALPITPSPSALPGIGTAAFPSPRGTPGNTQDTV